MTLASEIFNAPQLAADSSLQSAINSEVSARQASDVARAVADSSLSTRITMETSARLSADSSLSSSGGGVTEAELNKTALFYSLIF